MGKLVKQTRSLWVCGAVAAGGLLAASAPAAAQTAEELTVIGRYGPAGEVRTLSGIVSYRDLDLTTEAGRKTLKERIKTTARDLCVRLGEPPTERTPPAPSCQQAAIDNAWDQQQVALAQARPKSLAAASSAEARAATTYGKPASAKSRPAKRKARGGY